MDELMVEHVLRAVEAVPPGRVAAYGAIARLTGGTARQAGAVLRCYGANVAWWRVVNASGDLPAHLREAAREHWAAEAIAWKSNRLGCSMVKHGVDPQAWARAYVESTRDLPPYRRPGEGRPRQAGPLASS